MCQCWCLSDDGDEPLGLFGQGCLAVCFFRWTRRRAQTPPASVLLLLSLRNCDEFGLVRTIYNATVIYSTPVKGIVCL